MGLITRLGGFVPSRTMLSWKQRRGERHDTGLGLSLGTLDQHPVSEQSDQTTFEDDGVETLL